MEESSEWILGIAQQAKLHREMCRKLSRVLDELRRIFPSLEAVRPRCKPGMQALTGLHLALQKAKALLQYCASSSKLYLAFTGDSIVLKFGKVRDDLDQNLIQLAEIVSESLSNKVMCVLAELSQANFFLDPLDKQVGADIISLLLKEKDVHSGEEVIFEQVAIRLELISPKYVFEERQALKKLLEKAQSGRDKKKASILLYFLHLLKHYSKKLKNNSSNALYIINSSHKEITRSNTVPKCTGVDNLFREAETLRYETSMSAPKIPEQFRCPLSLQLMSDPVIIASGQTYERAFIERWFEEGHNTCPKTHQQLLNLSITQNTCVKNLIAQWCHNNSIAALESTSSPDLSVVSWNSESSMDGSMGVVSFSSLESSIDVEECTMDSGIIPESERRSCQFFKERKSINPSKFHASRTAENLSNDESSQQSKILSTPNEEWWLQYLEQLAADLVGQDWEVQCRSARNIRMLTRDIPRALAHIGDNILAHLVDFLGNALRFGCSKEQEVGILILLDLSIFDRKNEERMVAAEVVPHLLEILKGSYELKLKEVAISLLMVLSCTEENRKTIGLSGAIPILIELLDPNSCMNVSDTLIVLCNLSEVLANHRWIIQADTVPKLVHLLKVEKDRIPEKCLLLLYYISSVEEGRYRLIAAEGCIRTIVEFLGNGNDEQQEHAVAILLLFCNDSYNFRYKVRQQGVTSHLLTLLVQGSESVKDKAWKLLQLLHKQQCQDEHTRASMTPDTHLEMASTNLFSDTRSASLTYS